jgi:hypothetical protein
MEEIQNLPGFKSENPINKDNYAAIFGDYWFPDEVKCCREKPNGQLCGEGHKYGFVAKLKDESITIVGNYCAVNKFGADAKIKADRNKYLNEKRRREGFIRLGDLLAEKESRLSNLDALRVKAKQIQGRIKEFSGSLGERSIRLLQDMARSSNSSVLVDAVTYKDYIDEDGETKKERRVAPTKLGDLNGLSVFKEYTFQAIYSEVDGIKAAYVKAETISENIKTFELEALIAAIGNYDHIAEGVAEIEKDQNAFFNNNFLLLCFLVDDKSERYKAARVALEQSGETGGKEKAKTWLADQERTIREKIRADKIDIRY